ncbi:MAG: PEGA domain-containing protein [Planctomycetota bacterium]
MSARTVAACALCALAMVGCVDRRILITSEPSGARVLLNDVDVGVTPAEVNFTYYGVYDVRLRKEGYEPLRTTAEAAAPWHEYPIVDLVSMGFGPKDVRIEWHFDLVTADTDPDALLDRAGALRERFEPTAQEETETAPE